MSEIPENHKKIAKNRQKIGTFNRFYIGVYSMFIQGILIYIDQRLSITYGAVIVWAI